MTLAKDFEDFVKLLNKHQVNYMVVGGYALAFHGKPRHTGDLDIWINNSKENAEKLVLAIIHNLPLPIHLPPSFPSNVYPARRIKLLQSGTLRRILEQFQLEK